MSNIVINTDGEYVSNGVIPNVKSDNIEDDAIVTDKIKDAAVDSSNLADDAATKAKVNYVTLPVIVAPMATTGESDPDGTIVNGEILGYYPTGNQDAFVTNVEITADAKAKITLASAATAPNTFNVVILKN